MKLTRRHWLVAAGLLTAALAWFAPEDRDAGPARPKRSLVAPPPAAERAARPAAVAATLPASAAVTPLALADRQATLPESIPDLFRSTTWYVPPPPPPVPDKPPPPPPPAAPALPFAFMGRVIEDGHQEFILSRGNRVVTVAVGDNIDKNYRLEASDGGVLTFVYLPLDIRQTLTIGTLP